MAQMLAMALNKLRVYRDKRPEVAGHKSLPGHRLAYRNVAKGRQQRAYDIVRKHHVLTVARVNCRKFALYDARRPVPKFGLGGWAWVYNTATVFHQRAKPDTGG